MRIAWKRALLCGGASLVALLGFELVLRWTHLVEPHVRWYPGERASEPSQNFRADEHLGWTMHPHVAFTWRADDRDVEYRADADGHRRGEREPAPAPAARTVVVCGDSFAFGVGVAFEETFGARLERAVSGIRVVNVAQPGYGVDQIVVSALAALKRCRPVVLIVALYVEDFDRTATAYRTKERMTKSVYAMVDAKRVALGPESRPGAFRLWLERDCFTWAALEELDRKIGTFWPVGARWAVNASLLDELAAACRDHNTCLVLLHVPEKTWRPFPALARFARGRGWECVDPVALEPDLPHGAYLERDSHWSADGHRRAAEWLESSVRSALAGR